MNDQSLPFEGKQPRVEVIDREKDILVRAEIPGVDKDDLEISVSDNSVTINGTTHHEKKKEKDNYHQSEVSHGTFTCTVALSSNVDADKAETTYKDGLLELTLPKVAKSKALFANRVVFLRDALLHGDFSDLDAPANLS